MSDLHAEEVEEEEEPQLRKNGGGGNKNGGGKSEGGLVVQTVHRQESIHLFFTPFTTQIAGHGSEENDGHLGFLKRQSDGRLLKPLQAPPKGERESGFYRRLYRPGADETDLRFRRTVPGFFGTEAMERVNGVALAEEYLVLQDVTEGFALPNIMDVKIGSRTWGPDASEKKQRQEDLKYKGTKMPLGFSVLGIIVHPIRGDSDEMTKYDKSFGRDLKTEEADRAPRLFFDADRSGVVEPLVRLVLGKMRDVQKLYEEQRRYHTYASSLLFAYDAAQVRRFLAGEVSESKLSESVDVKLIDFAHAFEAEGGKRDENFLRGIGNLIGVFEGLLNKKKD